MDPINAKLTKIEHEDGTVTLRFTTAEDELPIRISRRDADRLLDALMAAVPVVGTAG